MAAQPSNQQKRLDDEPKRYERWLRIRTALLIVVAAAVATRTAWLLSQAWPFDTDDAFITLRYSRNLIGGHGLTWNPGENPPVEGYSNFLFVIIGAAALAVGANPLVVFKVVSVLALVGVVALQFSLARRWMGPMGSLIPATAYTSYIGTIMWTVSGLETTVFTLLVLATLATFSAALPNVEGTFIPDAGPQRRRTLVLFGVTGMLAALCGLTRPEGPLVIAAVAVGLIAHRGRAGNVSGFWRASILVFATFALPYSAYFAWRSVQFDQLVPNTVLCKAAYTGDPMALDTPFLEFAWPLLALVLFAIRKGGARFLALASPVLIYIAILYGADPIIGHWNRHFLAAWACLLIPGTYGGVRVFRRVMPSASADLPEGVATVLVLAITTYLAVDYEPWMKRHADRYAQRTASRLELGEWINEQLTETESFLIGDAGAVPYRARANAIDAFCLNNRELAHRPYNGEPARYVSRALERKPELIVVHSARLDSLVPRTDYGFFPALVADRRFRTDYELVRTFQAPGEQLSYWVFALRQGGPTAAGFVSGQD